VTPPETQPEKPVSGFAIATLVLGLMGIILPAVMCGIVALGQIRGGSSSGKGMAIAGLLISAAWVLLLAWYIAMVVVAWQLVSCVAAFKSPRTGVYQG
jgi:Domain of unknown function (DUF4190)